MLFLLSLLFYSVWVRFFVAKWYGLTLRKSGTDAKARQPLSCTLGISEMEQKYHPTHARARKYALVTLVLFALTFVALGSTLLNIYGRHGLLENVLVLIWFGFGFLFFVLFHLSTQCCRCPTCKKWLTKKDVCPGNGSRKFFCRTCNIAWDSGVNLEQE